MASRFLSEFGGRMKKILVVVPSLGIGGQERIAVNTARCLSNEYCVELVVFQTREREYQTDVPVHNLNLPTQKNRLKKVVWQMRRALKLARLRNSERVDFVYSLGMTANLTNVLSGLISKGKTIISIHGFAEVKRNRANTFIFRKANAVVCIAQEMQYQLLALYPQLKNTVVIENGYDLETVLNAPLPERVFDKSAPRLIAMGRLEDVKRYGILINAFAIVANAIPKASLSILGEGTKQESLQNLAKSLGLEQKVSFLGYQANPYDTLKDHDIFALTSKNEGFPNALIEVMSCGLAIVSVDCLSGPREILSEHYMPTPVQGICFEKYGVLVENFADEGQLIKLFAEALIRLIRTEDKVLMYQKNGKSRATDFSLDVYKDKLCKLFD